MRLEGDVTTTLVGFDVARGTWLAGLALSTSTGDGPYSMSEGDKSGEIESSLTALYPYARLSVNDRQDVWRLAGVGTGELTVRPDDGRSQETDLGMRMGGIGARGSVLEASETQPWELIVRSDAMWVAMKSDEVRARSEDGGHLSEAEADVSRLRLIVEGSRPVELEGGGTFTQSAKMGRRRQGDCPRSARRLQTHLHEAPNANSPQIADLALTQGCGARTARRSARRSLSIEQTSVRPPVGLGTRRRPWPTRCGCLLRWPNQESINLFSFFQLVVCITPRTYNPSVEGSSPSGPTKITEVQRG